MAKRNIALMVGPNSNKIISEHLSKLNDSIELTSYDTISTLVKVSTMRRKFFERIVFSSKVLTDSPDRDLKELSTYLYENSSSTTLVFVVRGGQKDLIKKFNKVFKAPLYTIAVIDSPTTKDLMNVVTLAVDEVKERYSQVGTAALKEDKKAVKPVAPVKKETIPQEKSKKRGFFSRLFGKKDKEGQEKVSEEAQENLMSDTLSQTGDIDLDINNLSLGSFADSHADTGYLGEDEISSVEGGDVLGGFSSGDSGLGDASFADFVEMKEREVLKPQETVGQTPVEMHEMTTKNQIGKGAGVLVGGHSQREFLVGKWLVIGSGNPLDEISKDFEVVVDLDTTYRPMRKLVGLDRFGLAKEGMKFYSNEGKRLYSEGYSNPDLAFRGKELESLIKRSTSIIVNASIQDLDSIKECLKFFDKIKIIDNGGMEVYLDLDNEEKVLSTTLTLLKGLNPDTTTLKKELLVSRRVW